MRDSLDIFTDPRVSSEEIPRIGGQNAKVLARLRMGTATNIELAEYSGSTRVNSRVADVRRFLRASENKTIECIAVDVSSGIHAYTIIPDEQSPDKVDSVVLTLTKLELIYLQSLVARDQCMYGTISTIALKIDQARRKIL